MKPIYFNFSKAADTAITDSTKRTKILAVALAVAASNLASLPTSQVDSPSNHFNMQVLSQVREAVAEFNENIVFDCKATLDYVRIFWMLRYTAAHPLTRPIYSLNFNFFESVMGVGTFVSPELQCFVNEHKDQILYLSTIAAEIIYQTRVQDA